MARVGLFQLDILWENVQGNIEKVDAFFEKEAHQGFDLLILPELWSCGFTMNKEAHRTFEPGLAYMKSLSQKAKCAVLGGLPAKTETGQENRCYLVEGDQARHYAKMRVFKYAGEHHKYEPGTQTRLWDVAGFRLAPFICYDLRFPELARSTVPEATLITYIASWPHPRVAHWRKLLVARAIENQCFVIGVNRVGRDGAGLDYSGCSLAVDPNGDLVLDAGDREGLFTCEIDAQAVSDLRARLPFLLDMNL